MHILLTGATGQIGAALQERLTRRREMSSLPLVTLTATTRATLDLTRHDAVCATLRDKRPDVIINAAAFTRVDDAEQTPERADAVNHQAVGVIAEEARKIGALFIHYSTDYVFDGRATHAYTEKDTAHPPNSYGVSKKKGEDAIRAIGGPHLILRTSRIYSQRGRNFFLSMLAQASTLSPLKVVNDQFGTPNSAAWVAEKTVELLSLPMEKLKASSGIYHLSAVGRASWLDFARAIFNALPQYAPQAIIGVDTPTYSQSCPDYAPRPPNAVLSSRLFFDTLAKSAPPTWEGVFEDFIQPFLRKKGEASR